MISQSNRGATASFGVVLILCCLAGCGGDSPVAVDDYTARLSRVLDQPQKPAATYRDMERFPRKRVLQLEFTTSSIDLLEFLDIGECELQSLVAERNSSLGRLAEPSLQLVYEINFLRTGSRCVALLRDSEPVLAGKLDRVLQVKKAELPARVWQATLGGEEFRKFWAVDGAREMPEAGTVLAVRALRASAGSWLAGRYLVDAASLEQNLERIARGGGGAILDAWWHLRLDMQKATLVLKNRDARRPLCFGDMRNPDAEIFRTVVTDFFLAGIQREVSELNRATFDVLQEVRGLERLLSGPEPAAYARWREARAVIVSNGRQAMVDHVDAIEPFFRQCGFLPAR